MGQNQTYVRGRGSHRFVPPPMNGKVQLYSSDKRLKSQTNMSNVYSFDRHINASRKRIDWDIKDINEEGYDFAKYEEQDRNVHDLIFQSIFFPVPIKWSCNLLRTGLESLKRTQQTFKIFQKYSSTMLQGSFIPFLLLSGKRFVEFSRRAFLRQTKLAILNAFEQNSSYNQNPSDMQATIEQKNAGEEMLNINRLTDWQDANKCTFCQEGSNYGWGFVKPKVHPEIYSMLLQRGWRRRGTYYEKNDPNRSCCPQWTLKQDVTKFRIKKDQRKTIRKLLKLAFGTLGEGEANRTLKNMKNKGKPQINAKITVQISQQNKNLMKQLAIKLNRTIKQNKNKFMNLIQKKYLNEENFVEKLQLDTIINQLRFFVSKPEQDSDYYCNYVMLLFGLNKKLFKKQYKLVNFTQDIKNFVQIEGRENNKFDVEVQRGGYLLLKYSEKMKEETSDEFQVIEFDEDKINLDAEVLQQKIPQCLKCVGSPDKLRKKIRISSDEITLGRITIKIQEVDQDEESWKLYQKYCDKVHKKSQKSMSTYLNSFCEKGLIYLTQEAEQPPKNTYFPSWENTQIKQEDVQPVLEKRRKRMGCFNMKYYLENKLIGVGVIDIIPDGLSSVYFFYDPEYKDYRLGIFSSLIEIEYIRWMQLSFPEFKNYYLGSYIQNNPKMNYKVNFEPCQLLCPITYNFVEFTPELKAHIHKITQKEVQSVRLAPENIAKKTDMHFTQDMGVFINKNVQLKYRNKQIKLSQITPDVYVPVLNYLRNYLQVWGKELFKNFTFTF